MLQKYTMRTQLQAYYRRNYHGPKDLALMIWLMVVFTGAVAIVQSLFSQVAAAAVGMHLATGFLT